MGSTESTTAEEVNVEPAATEENITGEGVSTETISNDEILEEKVTDNEIFENVDINGVPSVDADDRTKVKLELEQIPEDSTSNERVDQVEASDEVKPEEKNIDKVVVEEVPETAVLEELFQMKLLLKKLFLKW